MAQQFAKGHSYTELYEVVTSVEGFIGGQQYRVEVLKDLKATNSGDQDIARFYVKETFQMAPIRDDGIHTMPRPAQNFEVWVEDSIQRPRSYGPTVDIALARALGFLEGLG